MNQDEFEREQSRAFEALKEARGRCPETDVLVRFSENDLDGEEQARLNAHLSLCGLCLELVQRLRQEDPAISEHQWRRIEKNLDRRTVPWRTPSSRWSSWIGFGIPAAAAAGLVLAAGLWLSDNREPALGPVSPTRGDFIQLQEPSGRVGRVEAFRWNQQPAAAGFRLEIQEGEKRIWEDATTPPFYNTPEGLRALLRARTVFRWRVQAVDSAGRVLGESGWMEFEISP
jgi:hypothetical protein